MRWLRRAAVVLVGAAIFYLVYPTILSFAAQWLDVSESPRASHFALTLPGDEQSRPFVSAALVNVGLADKALVLGTVATPSVEDEITLPSDEVTKLVLKRRGVPESQILVLHGDSDSTFSDAEIIDDFLQGQPDITIAVVTSAFHTRRARWTFRRVLGKRADQLYFVAAPTENLNPDAWWTCEKGVRIYLGEYGKFFLYLIRYGDLRAWGVLMTSILLVPAFLYWRRHRSSSQGAASIF